MLSPGMDDETPELQVILHADNTREYIVASNAQLITQNDFVWAALSLLLLYIMGPTVIANSLVALIVIKRLVFKFFIIKEETILVVRDVGVQVKTVYLTGRSVSRFIDRSKIKDIIINEAITMMHIRVYMAIIVEGEDRMVVVFHKLLPRLKILLQAYHGARSIIFNEQDHPETPLYYS